MSSSFNRVKKNIIEAMQSTNNQGTSAYDSVAEVRRVEGDTAWVHIAGGVDETPVKLTIAAKAGDVVQVRVGGGRAWITGNASAPPTDDKTAIAAKGLANIAGNRAKTAQTKANEAENAAATAQGKADSAGIAASKAQSSANAAGEAAASAQSTAEAAQTAAGAAQTTADKASAAASTAQSSADTAAQAAATAQSTADAAKASASSASNAASAAQKTADTATTNAATAQSTADTAVTNAATAQSTADTAVTNAATAQTIADVAKKLVEKINRYFWTDDDGVHITTTPQGEPISGINTLITNEGTEVRDGNTTLASFKGDSINIGTQDATRLGIGASALAMYVLGAKVFDMSGAGLTIGLSAGGYSSLNTRKLVVGGELFDEIFRTMQVYSGDKLAESTGITVNAGESVNVNCRLPYAVKSVDDIEGSTGITEVHALTGLVSSHGWTTSVSSDGYSVKLSGTVPATTDDGTAANDLVLRLTGITPAAASVSETYGGGYAEFRDSIKAGGWIEASTMQAEKIALSGNDIKNLFSGSIYVGFVDKSLSIAASGNTGEGTIDLSKSGYSARCICGWNMSGTGASNCVIPKLYVNNPEQKIHYYIKNTGSSKATPTIRIYILYTKNN